MSYGSTLKEEASTKTYSKAPMQFRDVIGPGSKFLPAAGRYHLYVLLACPWAHRCLITRVLKGLTSVVGLSIVHWHMGETSGWRFYDPETDSPETGHEQGTIDHVNGFKIARELYLKADSNYIGRITVPILWDKQLGTIVNNESSEIIRIFNSGFDSIIPQQYKLVDIYPEALREKIEELNDWIYPNINLGVYKAGFAKLQDDYETQVLAVFEYLDKLELILAENHKNHHEFLTGNQLTEADVRLYTTIVRFDVVYHQHFKCNIRMIRSDYPNIHQWLRLLYWKIPGFKETTDFGHIKKHYTKSHKFINPLGITPVGPIPDIKPL